MRQIETSNEHVEPRLSQSILVLVLLPLLIFTITLLILKDASLQAEKILVLEDQRCASVRQLCLISSSSSDLGYEMLALGTQPADTKQKTINGNEKRVAAADIEGNPFVTDLLSIDRLLSAKAAAISMRDRILSEWQDELRLRKTGDKRVREQKTLAVIVAGIDVLIAITALGLAFRTFVARLQILMKNAASIGMKKSGLSELDGNDEITSLNNSLKSIHQDLIESSDLYEMTVSMVAHDVRSPLTASLVNLRSIEAIVSEHYDEAEAKLTKFTKRVEAELAFVGDLLERQKEKLLQESEMTPKPETSARVRTENKWIRLNLLPKGLLLLLIPLFVQIAFLGIVNLEINRKLNVVNEARGLSEWMTNFQLSKLDFISAVSSYASYLFTGNSDLHSDFELSLLSIRSRLDELARISSSKDEWQKLAHESENVFKTQMSLVRQTDLEKSAGGSDGVKAKLDQLRASLPALRVLRKDFFELSQIEAARLEKREAEIIRESDETSTLFFWGIVGNIIISVVLLHWFKSDVQRRLYNLRLNAKNMIKQDLQFAPVSGHDELSKLNTILARTKEEIDSNFRRRENLTQELVSRLVMPLQQLKIEMLELVRTSRTKLPERALNHAEQFTKNIDRTLQIISLLEQTGKRDCNKMNLEIELCDSDNLIKEAVESLQEFITFKGILVERNTDSIKIPADKQKLVQVLINLLSNAIKFSPKNSTIELRAENENGELARFSVKDAGPGLSSEDQAKIFDRFVQGEAAEKKNGYGMGLAICKMIVEAHGGQIGVSSKENSGSTFWFVLPFKPGLITRETPELGADSTPEENSSVENVSTERVLDHTSNRISVWGKDDFSILGFFCCLFAAEFYFYAHIDQNLRKLESNLKVQKLPQVQGNIADDEKARRMLELAITKFHTSPSKQERLEIIESVNKLIIETDKPEIKFASYVSKADFEIVLGQVKNAIAAQKQAIIYSLQNGQETALTGRCYSLMAMYYFRLWEEFHSSSQNFAKLLEQYAQRSLDLLENETTPASSTKYSSLIHNSLPSSQMSRYLDYCYLGKIYIRRMDKHSLEKAIKYLTTARSLAQTSELGLASAEARANLATALWLSGQKKESFELIHGLEMNVRHDANPENENQALAWHSIAKYYDSINDKRKALESFKFGLDCVEKLKQNKSVLRNLFDNSIKQVEQR